MKRTRIPWGVREIVERLSDGHRLHGPVTVRRRTHRTVTYPWGFERGGVVPRHSVEAAARKGLIRVESDGDHHVAVLA